MRRDTNVRRTRRVKGDFGGLTVLSQLSGATRHGIAGRVLVIRESKTDNSC